MRQDLDYQGNRHVNLFLEIIPQWVCNTSIVHLKKKEKKKSSYSVCLNYVNEMEMLPPIPQAVSNDFAQSCFCNVDISFYIF